jgi:hypothetical protein
MRFVLAQAKTEKTKSPARGRAFEVAAKNGWRSP